MTIKFTAAALENINETGADVAGDLAALRSGEHTAESLLAFCLDGADDDRAEGWRDYVSALVAASAAIDPDAQCREHGCARWRCNESHA